MRKKILWAVITLCLSVLTIIALFYNGGLSLPELWQDIREASLGWLVAAAFCMLGFIFFEGRSLALFFVMLLKRQSLLFGMGERVGTLPDTV